VHADLENPETATAKSPWKRKIAVIVAALVLVGAGIGVAVGVSGGSKGGNSPVTAVNALLTAAQNDDLIGVLDAIEPGERAAVEPGLVTFIHQLQRLQVLSSSANLNHVSGLSFHFSGVQTATKFLDSSVAAVTITHGTMTSGADPSKLPLGSFVTGLVGALINKPASTQTSSAKTGKSSIVTVNDNGSWYVSLGYTIAINAMTSNGVPAVLPAASEAIAPTGASTPGEAVTSFLNSIAALDLNSVIADLPPGELGVLQRLGPLFGPATSAGLAKARQTVQLKFTSIATSAQTLGSITLVRVKTIGLKIVARGVTITLHGKCETMSYLGRSKTTCTTANKSQAIFKLLPADVRALITRLGTTQPDLGLVTVQENGKWFVSPVATLLQVINAFAEELQPQDLTMIAGYAKNPAAAKQAFSTFERALLGLVVSGASVV
jgi:hypothetical protein